MLPISGCLENSLKIENFSLDLISSPTEFKSSETFSENVKFKSNVSLFNSDNVRADLYAYKNSSCASAAPGVLTNPLGTVSSVSNIFTFPNLSYANSGGLEEYIYLKAKTTNNKGSSACTGPYDIRQRFNVGVGFNILDENGYGIYSSYSANYREEAPGFIYTDSQGRILIVSSAYGSLDADATYTGGSYYSRIILVRYLPNGTLDTSFGTNGVKILGSLSQTMAGLSTPFLDAWGYGYSHDSFYSAMIDSEGRLIVFGNSDAPGNGYNTGQGFVARFNQDGNFDITFGTNGIFMYNLGGTGLADASLANKYDSFRAIVEHSDKSLFIAGNSYNIAGGSEAFIAKLTPNGTLDTAFNGTGFTLFNHNGTGITGVANATKYDEYSTLHITSDNKIVVVGRSKNATGGYQLIQGKFNFDGTPYVSFSATGVSTLSYKGGSTIAGATGAAQRIYFGNSTHVFSNDGTKFYIRGSSRNASNGYDGFVCRFTIATFTIDTSFGDQGCYILNNNSAGLLGALANTKSEHNSGIKINTDDSIILAGRGSGGGYYGYVFKLNSTGQLDTSFGTSGYVIRGPNDWYTALHIDSRGRILVGGEYLDSNGNWPLGITRFLPDGSLDL